MMTKINRVVLLTALAAGLAGGNVHASEYLMKIKVDGLKKSVPQVQTDFTSHTFTTCGKTGRMGPLLSQCQDVYAGNEIMGDEYAFDVISGIQYWTVPASNRYRITVNGAQGGGRNGGSGASMQGEFVLSGSERLKILIGQKGRSHNDSSSGGGGGTFVALSDNTPLIIAGGGSGGINGYSGDPGVTSENSSQGRNFGIRQGGKIYYQDSRDSVHGSGGAGFLGDGEKGGVDQAALSFIHGGVGATGYNTGGWGGFGGGGGYHNSGSYVAGGGGGYTGGHGNYGRDTHRAGGGGSFNSGGNQQNTDGASLGHGSVIVELIP